MNKYQEKEKKLENVLKKLNFMSNRVAKINYDMNKLSEEKTQLLREKEESERNLDSLTHKHKDLKLELEKANKDVRYNFGNQNNFKKKIDELNQETETLVDEIDKWQM
jgi:chromosome segregation ATPase